MQLKVFRVTCKESLVAWISSSLWIVHLKQADCVRNVTLRSRECHVNVTWMSRKCCKTCKQQKVVVRWKWRLELFGGKTVLPLKWPPALSSLVARWGTINMGRSLPCDTGLNCRNRDIFSAAVGAYVSRVSAVLFHCCQIVRCNDCRVVIAAGGPQPLDFAWISVNTPTQATNCDPFVLCIISSVSFCCTN